MPYPELLVRPMREQLTLSGVRELTTADQVDEFFDDAQGTALLMFNSVCGCAAGTARPGVIAAIADESRPDHVVTVFAGQDVEATDRARKRFPQIPASSPSLLLLRDGQVTHHFPRSQIEGRSADTIAMALRQAFAEVRAASTA